MYTPPANNLILDTNTWLYLSNGFDQQSNSHSDNGIHFELLIELKRKLEAGEISILINDIILQEWERNNAETNRLIERLEHKHAEVDKRLVADKRYMTQEDIIAQQQINDRVKANFQKEIERNKQHIIHVEKFLKSSCKRIPISDAVKLKVWTLGIDKKAPFHRNKNNIADATILLSAIEYITSEDNDNVNSFFISNNTEDFCESKSANEFHPDIDRLIQVNSLVFQRRLDVGLKVSEAIQRELDEFYKEAYYDSIQFACKMPNCQGTESFSPTGYLTETAVVVQEMESKIDPNQLSLFDLEEHPKERETVQMGDCNTCGSTHIECPVCSELVMDVMPGYDFCCPNCYTNYDLGYSWDDGTLEIIIRDPTDENVIDQT